MPEGMIERMARTIDPDAWSRIGTFDESAFGDLRNKSIAKARAVLAAMREPTAEMNNAAWGFDKSMTAKHREPYSVLPDEYWISMIDAALAE